MTVNPVSQSYAVDGVTPIQNQTQQKPEAPAAPQDTVHISAQAKAALGDVDHDGDSH